MTSSCNYHRRQQQHVVVVVDDDINKENDASQSQEQEQEQQQQQNVPRDTSYSIIPTSTISFVETEHGRLRRSQRGIDKKDLQSAFKYGTREDNDGRLSRSGNPTSKYIYKDITYIVDDVTKEEITSFAVPMKLDFVPLTGEKQQEHILAQRQIQTCYGSWTSNTVLVVDSSGSMRNSDMWGTRTRLGAVWVSMALDYIAYRLETKQGQPTDVISIVTFGGGRRGHKNEASILVEEEPCTWVLYNKLVTIYNYDYCKPQGHGPFLPALGLAEKLLTRNSVATCPVALIFLSDGAPSDHKTCPDYLFDLYGRTVLTHDEWQEEIAKRVGKLAQKFGRRLAFTAIGIGNTKRNYQNDEDNNDTEEPKESPLPTAAAAEPSHQFPTLQKMVDAAAEFGAHAELQLPSMSLASLGESLTSVATLVTSTRAEMTDIRTLRLQRVRNVLRESRTKANENIKAVAPADFWIYPISNVKRKVYTEIMKDGKFQKSYTVQPLLHPEARYVAISKGPFGEGAERLAYRFFEIAANGRTILGKPLVAKESRMVLEDEHSDKAARTRFVRSFCSTQQLARRYAQQFNEKMDSIPVIHPQSPRVTFLDCSIYEIQDKQHGKLSVLVEEKINHNQWYKWNTNNGYVESVLEKEQQQNFGNDRYPDNNCSGSKTNNLDMIAEEFDEPDANDENQPTPVSCVEDEDEAGDVVVPGFQCKLFSASEIAQAFSHFTYLQSGRKRLVCDLQGVYDKRENLLKLSDPVIHYHHTGRSDRRNVHGRTDRGREGIIDFFQTHHKHHGELCKLMTRGFRSSTKQKQQGK